MADDEQVVNQQGEVETPDAGATTAESKTTSPEVQDVAETQETQATDEFKDEEISSLSERAQKRFRELSQKAKRADELETQIKATREGEQDKFLGALSPKPEAVSRPIAPPVQGLPWEQSQTNPTEITLDDYKRDVTLTADAIAQARVADAEFRLRKENEVKSDYQKIASDWSELNPDSSEYKPELSNKLAKLFENQLRADPKSRLYDLVKTVMDVRESGREKGKEEVTGRLVQQKAEEAVTPSTETGLPPEKPEDIFSDPHRVAEQEAYLKKKGLWE